MEKNLILLFFLLCGIFVFMQENVKSVMFKLASQVQQKSAFKVML